LTIFLLVTRIQSLPFSYDQSLSWDDSSCVLPTVTSYSFFFWTVQKNCEISSLFNCIVHLSTSDFKLPFNRVPYFLYISASNYHKALSIGVDRVNQSESGHGVKLFFKPEAVFLYHVQFTPVVPIHPCWQYIVKNIYKLWKKNVFFHAEGIEYERIGLLD